MRNKLNIVKPLTIEEAIYNLRQFFECDMWYACKHEWKNEEAMLHYLDENFKILERQVKKLKDKP